MAETRLNLRYRVPDKQRLRMGQARSWRRWAIGPRRTPQRGIRPRADHPARAAVDRSRRAGASDRRHRHRDDAEGDLRLDRPEDQAAKPAPADDGDRTGQRRRRLHPAAGTASPRRLQHLGRTLGRAGGRRPSRRSSRRPSACWRQSPARPRTAYRQRTRARRRRRSSPSNRRLTGDWTSSPGPRALDQTGNRDAIYEPGVVFFLEGPRADAFCAKAKRTAPPTSRAGRLNARVPRLGDQLLGLALDLERDARRRPRGLRLVLRRGRDHDRDGGADLLGLGGTGDAQGKLLYSLRRRRHGARGPLIGRSNIERWTWNHVVLVRDGRAVRVHLNGDPHAGDRDRDARADRGSRPVLLRRPLRRRLDLGRPAG